MRRATPSNPPLLLGIGASSVEVTYEIEESLVAIPYLIMDGLNGSELALIP